MCIRDRSCDVSSAASTSSMSTIRRLIPSVSSTKRACAQSKIFNVPSISAAKYKIQNRAEQQAKLFPELEQEISDRRQRLHAVVRDQSSDTYKDEICEKVKQLKLCPKEHLALLSERVIRPFSDRFWDEGCAAPSIKGFKAHISLRPGAHVPFRQPYRLSKYDETRLIYLYEEAEKEGKVERYELGSTPPCVLYSCIYG